MIVTAGKEDYFSSSSSSSRERERKREREEQEQEQVQEKRRLSLIVLSPRADDTSHRAVVRDLEGRRVGERSRLLQQPRAGARAGVFAVFSTEVAAGLQEALQRRRRVVAHPPARGHKLHRGLALPAPFGPTGDEEVVPPGEQRGARDVGGVPADRAGGGKGLERGAVGGVDVAVSTFFFMIL